MSKSDWTSDDLLTLRRMWDAGHACAAIATALGRTKNSIVGMAYRSKLSARPSPIRRRSETVKRPRAPARVRPSASAVPKVQPAAAVVATVRSAPWVRVARVLAPRYDRLLEGCCWPIGEPGTRGFRLCDAPAVPRRPYCPAHCAEAYCKPQMTLEQQDRLARTSGRRA